MVLVSTITLMVKLISDFPHSMRYRRDYRFYLQGYPEHIPEDPRDIENNIVQSENIDIPRMSQGYLRVS